jgi:hypothetical protein
MITLVGPVEETRDLGPTFEGLAAWRELARLLGDREADYAHLLAAPWTNEAPWPAEEWAALQDEATAALLLVGDRSSDQLRWMLLQVVGEGVAKYAPDQPREPAGTPEGGRWAPAGGGGSGGGGDRGEGGRAGNLFVHGTTGDVVQSILREGLRSDRGHVWYESRKGPIYAADRPDRALQWIELSGWAE